MCAGRRHTDPARRAPASGQVPPATSRVPARAGRECAGTPSEEGPQSLPSAPRLADVASARRALARLFNVSTASPWICFGGSYAGSLAAWARLKVPGTLGAGWGRGPVSDGRCTQAPFAPPAPPVPQSCLHQSARVEGRVLPKTTVRGSDAGAGGAGSRSLGPQADRCPPSVPSPHSRLRRLLRSGARRAGFLGV